MCRLLDVSASGYYAWLERAPSARAVSDAELLEKIRAIHIASRGTYGAPRILHELRETHELHVSRKRVARLMREAGIQGVHRRKRAHTTIRDDDARPAPDLVDRNFEVDRPDRLWVADISVPQQAAREMGVGPPESLCRRRFQTTVSGCGQKPWS